MGEDSLLRALLYAWHRPAKRGLKVDGVTTRDMVGFTHPRRGLPQEHRR